MQTQTIIQTTTPVQVEPAVDPSTRLNPDSLCPNQKEVITALVWGMSGTTKEE